MKVSLELSFNNFQPTGDVISITCFNGIEGKNEIFYVYLVTGVTIGSNLKIVHFSIYAPSERVKTQVVLSGTG